MIGDDYGIRDLTFIIVRRGGQRWLEWDRMSVDLQKSLTDTVHSAHLTNAHFLHISCIPRSVFANSHLKHLQLKAGGWKPSQRFMQALRTKIIMPPTPDLAPQLESFRTDHSHPIEYFEPELDSSVSSSESPFSHLSTLASSVLAPQDFLDCTKTLERAAHAIKNLHLTFSLQIYEPSKSLDFELFPELRDLEILYLGGPLFGPFEDGICHILRLLDCPSTSNKLSSIRLIVKLSGIYYYPRDGSFSPAGSTISTDWRALDSLLSGPKYSSVQTLLFLFRIEFIDKPIIPSEDIFITGAVDRFNLIFPKALKSGRLKIIVEVG
ncbi:hypothetical protein GALMADRAFT_246275 [Galerina marginata CBS 339.88]|uniref:Uncharacterized protein n=1 Tax=Galerina marginata (strain CBS 339.88) TaxID=685588 RepID=A0A067TB21_GALM3|nr:hypothetical protein GALMADRAFT_246275 [Galerina marginata CBS 339.88]